MSFKDGTILSSGVAKGVAIKGNRRQVVIKMDADQFEAVRQLAVKEKCSMAHQLRLLIEWGLEAVQDGGLAD